MVRGDLVVFTVAGLRTCPLARADARRGGGLWRVMGKIAEMAEVSLVALGVLLIVLGYIGCVVPVMPGPVLAYGALWAMLPFGHSPGTVRLAVGAAAVLVAMVLDYVLPSMFAKRFNCSRMGIFGCMAGTVVGLFYLPLGLIVGPFVGTVIGELIVGKCFLASMKGGLGALLGFVVSLLVKLSAVSLFAYWFFVSLA